MPYPFVPARYQTIAHREAVDYIVIHTMELPCREGMALSCAHGFQREMKPGRRKSAHWCIDPVNAVQCVLESNVAFHCPKGNRRGVGVELAAYGIGDRNLGIAPTDWASPEAQLLLKTAAGVVAETARRWNIPLVRLTVDQVAHMSARGIAGHSDFSKAFATPGGHQDPGPAFPWDEFLRLAVAAMTR